MFCGPAGCGFGWGFGILGFLTVAIIWALIIAGIVALVRYLRAPRVSERTPLEILKERYARGEISKEEFEKMKKDLES
jgi:putative membrane protein